MIPLVFGFVVAMMIGAGVLISRLAEIAKTDRGKKTWIWGIIILIALIAVPLVLLGVIVKFAQYSSVAGVFESLGNSE
jgi:cytochrome b subunit of formate dehydrogenase